MKRHEKKPNCLIIFLMGVCFLLATTNVGADENHAKRKARSKGGINDPVSHILNFADELGLSDNQYVKIKAAQLNYKKKDIRITANIKIARLDLRNLLHAGSFDEAKILTRSDELAEFAARKIKLNMETIIKVFKVLTPEQIKKVKELRLLPNKIGHKGKREGS